MLLTVFITLLSALLGMTLLIFLDGSTLFLAALLLAVIAIKTVNKGAFLDKLTGMWFAMSVAPAFGVPLGEVMDLENGFLLQSLLSLLFFLYFYQTKPSVIQKIYENSKAGVGVVVSSAIAGFAAGILSAALWQGYQQITA